MDLDDIVRERGPTVGMVYGVKIDEYTFEGTYAGMENDALVLRTGRKYGPEGTKQFDRQELPLSVAKSLYPL